MEAPIQRVIDNGTVVQLDAGLPSQYLRADDIVESDHPDVIALGAQLREGRQADRDFARAAFEWVRDNVVHAYDAQDRRVTLTATEVLNDWCRAERAGAHPGRIRHNHRLA